MQYEDTPERPQCGADTTAFLSDVYNRSTRAQKRLVDVPQSGRSMVEMLGVLAIIGVLSVGGIAGYSKAIQMYNENIQKNQISELIAASIRIKATTDLRNITQHLVPAIEALNMLPQGTYVKGNFIYNNYGSSAEIYAEDRRIVIAFWMNKQKSQGPKFSSLCLDIYNFAKQYPKEIMRIMINKDRDSDTKTRYNYKTTKPNDAGDGKYLPDVSMPEIRQACNDCAGGKTCHVSLYLR